MKRIPPELDQIMWTLVEQDNDRAIKEFVERHPECRAELMRRASMVVGLKRAKPESAKVLQPPPFRPRVQTSAPPFGRGAIAFGIVAIAALGAASFFIGNYIFPGGEQKPIIVGNPVVVQRNGDAKEPEAVPNKMPDRQPVVEQPTATDPGPDETIAPAKLVTIRISKAPLLSVLEVIAAQSNLKIIPAPGMPNPDVDVEYNNLSAMGILQDLGQHHAFTAFDQGDGSIIAVPAIQQDGPENRGRIGG